MKLWNIFKKNPRLEEDGVFFGQLQNVLGFAPKDLSLYRQAFSHSSYVRGKSEDHNERMEYLGDAILDAVVSDYLYHKYPDEDEGFLTQNRSKIVSRKSLNYFARELHLEPMILEKLDESQRSRHLLGNVMEALLGAIYLDKGYDTVNRFIRERMIARFVDEEELHESILSYRSVIHEWAQKTRAELDFQMEDATGPSHDRTYRSILKIDGKLVSRGSGSSKKSAKEQAAREAIEKLGIQV
ncbi:ribonuclease III [Cryomorphaceae bacterium]|nr:ribonuclease III [Cryomorphaceae bacterium]